MKKSRKGSLLVFLVICYAVAFVASILTRPEIPTWYAHLAKPTWRPPNWLFAPVWTILYGMMAVAGWRVWCAAASKWRTAALWVFGIQLGLNFLWSPTFFLWHRIGEGFFVISSLWAFLLLFIVLTLKFERSATALFVPYLLWISFAATLNYTIWTMNPTAEASSKPALTAVALRLAEPADEQGFPAASSWSKAPAVSFDLDWKGENPTPAVATEVRLLWTPETLHLRFLCKYQSLNVYSDARNDGWRDQLWDRDVAETFLQPDERDPLKYKEFEVAPNGFWIDLDISHGEKQELRSSLKRRVVLDEKAKTWTAELSIPMRSLTESFDAKHDWRVNFYRVEGASEPRFYSAWSPTRTAEPNFHVPSRFGTLAFR
jgi:tryptophan-rich sensory protein